MYETGNRLVLVGWVETRVKRKDDRAVALVTGSSLPAVPDSRPHLSLPAVMTFNNEGSRSPAI